MPTYKKKVSFPETDEGIRTRQVLRAMVQDSTYNTEASYSANTSLYPENLIPFVDKHMAYLSSHPSTDPKHYLSNLRLMTRIKTP